MTTEKRITSSTGASKGDKIYRFDQIPAEPMLELAARYGLGSTKYPAVNGLDNWRNGYAFSLSLAALERHINAFKRGEDNDATIYAEAGLLQEGENPLYDEDWNLRPGVSHLAAAVWHCFFLMYHLEFHPELDDRPTTVLRRAEAGVAGTEEDLSEVEAIEAAIKDLAATTQTPQHYLIESDPDSIKLYMPDYSNVTVKAEDLQVPQVLGECPECAEYEAEREAEVKPGDSATLDDWQDLGMTSDTPPTLSIAPLLSHETPLPLGTKVVVCNNDHDYCWPSEIASYRSERWGADDPVRYIYTVHERGYDGQLFEREVYREDLYVRA